MSPGSCVLVSAGRESGKPSALGELTAFPASLGRLGNYHLGGDRTSRTGLQGKEAPWLSLPDLAATSRFQARQFHKFSAGGNDAAGGDGARVGRETATRGRGEPGCLRIPAP